MTFPQAKFHCQQIHAVANCRKAVFRFSQWVWRLPASWAEKGAGGVRFKKQVRNGIGTKILAGTHGSKSCVCTNHIWFMMPKWMVLYTEKSLSAHLKTARVQTPCTALSLPPCSLWPEVWPESVLFILGERRQIFRQIDKKHWNQLFP